MKTFTELKTYLNENKKIKGKYKGVPYYISNLGTMFTLYVDDEKIDTYHNQAAAEKAAKQYIDFAK